MKKEFLGQNDDLEINNLVAQNNVGCLSSNTYSESIDLVITSRNSYNDFGNQTFRNFYPQMIIQILLILLKTHLFPIVNLYFQCGILIPRLILILLLTFLL